MEITLSAVTYQDWREIVKKAVTQAKRGNPQARKFLADYLLGPPPQRHELTGKDGGPLTTMMVPEEDYKRAMATFHDAIGSISRREDSGGQDAVGAAEHAAMVGSADLGA